MTLETQSRVFVLCVFLILSISFWNYFIVEKKMVIQHDNYSEITRLVKGIFELNILTTEHLSTRSIRSELQWKKRDASLTNALLIAFSKYDIESKSGVALRKTRNDLIKIRILFSKILIAEKTLSFKRSSEIIHALSSQVRLASQKAVSDIDLVGYLAFDALKKYEQKAKLIINALMSVIALSFIIMMYWVRNFFLQPILLLKESAQHLIDGQYDFKINVKSNDELGSLALSVNSLGQTIKEKIHDLTSLSETLKKSNTKLEAALQKTESARLQYSNIFNVAIDSILTINTDGIILSSNPATSLLLGYSPEELLGKNISLLVSMEHKQQHDQYISNYLNTGISQIIGKGRQLKALHKDGHELDIHLSIMEIHQDGKKQFCGILRDISEELQSKETIRENNRQLEATNKDLESYAYSISHDLRSPLRSIDGFSLVMLEDYADQLDDEGKDYLRRIRAGTEKMSLLIQELLKMSRIDKEGINIQNIDLAVIAQEEINQLKAAYPDASINFVCNKSLAIYADKSLIRSVLENLLNNAVKYSIKNHQIKIELGLIEDNGNDVYYVKDNGVGFDMKHKNKLFKAFQRLHKINEFEGSGIGLATVQRIISRHNGEIWAEAEIGKGATFYFTLKASFTEKLNPQ